MLPGSFFANPNSYSKKNKINLDELYDRKHEKEQLKISIFDKILDRIHNKIKFTSRQKQNEQFLFFVVPEFQLGLPKYDVGECIGYLINELEDNGFNVKYTHPNLLFISWQHYIPAYQREMIKKNTGVQIDGFGNIINKNKKTENKENPNNSLFNLNNNTQENNNKQNNKDNFKSVDTYKPVGIYNQELLKKIQEKIG